MIAVHRTAPRRRVEELPVSKTRRKKEMHALQDLGEALIALPAGQLASLALPESLADAIAEARRITGFEAKRRQMQYIGRLMRGVDSAPIAERIAQLKNTHQRESARHHAIEQWRDRLLANDDAFDALMQEHPGCDLQQLRTLTRNARKEQAAGRPPHAVRALFRALREALEPVEPAN